MGGKTGGGKKGGKQGGAEKGKKGGKQGGAQNAGKGKGEGGPRRQVPNDQRMVERTIKDGTITSVMHANQFFDAILSVDDKMELLEVLSAGDGPKVVKLALNKGGCEAPFLRNRVVPFLTLLGSDEYTSGFCKDALVDLLKAIYKMPGFVRALERFVTNDIRENIDAIELAALGWFAVMCCKEIDDAREVDRPGFNLAQALMQKNAKASRQLKNILDGTTCTVAGAIGLEDIEVQAGGRHDNDFQDFRSIDPMPTIEELECEEQPYLPAFVPDEGRVLEQQFRLLREDLVGPARMELKMLRDGRGNRRNIFEDTEISAVGSPKSTKPCVFVKFNLPQHHPTFKLKWKARVDWWKDHGKGMLPLDALVVLVDPSTGEAKHFAWVVCREPEDLANEEESAEGKKYLRPGVGLMFRGDTQEVGDVLASLHNGPCWTMLQVTQNYFSYEPVLKALQKKVEIPLSEEILLGHRGKRPDYLRNIDMASSIADFMNPSQKNAVAQIFETGVGLMQGPPGTGKTTVSTEVIYAIYMNTDAVILIVAYTNHALDQLLEKLMDKGVKDIVRVGGRTKSTKLEPFQLNEMARKQATQSMQNGVALKRRAAKLYERRERAQAKKADGISQLKDTCLAWGAHKWDLVAPYLQDNHPEIYDELKVEIGFDIEGFSTVGNDGKKLPRHHKWNLWRKFLACPGKGVQASLPSCSVWNKTTQERLEMMEQWSYEIFKSPRESVAEGLVDERDAQASLSTLHDEPKIPLLRGARIIGCTTTGCTKYASLLASVQAKVLVTEESGELLEAHTLACLGTDVQHVIKIGDHKQLRPKIENHSLSVVSGNGHDLNRSMFERLVLSGHEHSMLQEQHRMHPDISRMIMDMGVYPELKNHPKTDTRPVLRGVSRRVTFIDHRVPEKQKNWKVQHDEGKSNPYEAEIAAYVARYFTQQSYPEDAMTLLTPYLGQVVELQKQLTEVLGIPIDINERDMKDLDAAGLDATGEDVAGNDIKKNGAGKTKGGKGAAVRNGSERKVRVSTIDNYQGEENNIVIISLVRSNEDNAIGFLKEPERLTVLLTRAQEGIVIIGNSECMRNAKNRDGAQMWHKLLTGLEERNELQQGLPVQCARHGRGAMLCTPCDFKNHAPNGGCTFECGFKLLCGHHCPLRCHSFDPSHQNVRCEIKVNKYCDQGHTLLIACGDKVTGCPICSEIKRIEKKRQEEIARINAEEANRKEQAALKKAKEEEELRNLQQEMANEEREKEEKLASVRRAIAKQKLQHELELMKNTRDEELQRAIDEEMRAAEKHMEEKEKEAEKKSSELAKKVQELKRKRKKAEEQDQRGPQDAENRRNRASADCDEDLCNLMRGAHADAETVDRVMMVADELRKILEGGADAVAPKLRELILNSSGANSTLMSLSFNCDERKFQNLLKRVRHSGRSEAEVSDLVKRAIKLLQEGRALDAEEILGKERENGDQPDDIHALFACCQLQLTQESEVLKDAKDTRDSIEPALTSGMDALLRALVLDAESGGKKFSIGCVFEACCAIVVAEASSGGPLATYVKNAARGLMAKHLPAVVANAQSSGNISGNENRNVEQSEEEEMRKRAGTSEALLELLKLTGLKNIKRQLLQLKEKMALDEERGFDFKKQLFNMRFDGNPGTGKTTVARKYAKFLKERGVLKEDNVEETSGAKLANGGTAEIKKIIEEKLKDGGVLFIDEAYQLNPKTNPLGAQVLDYLLPEMENRRDNLVVIVAGYRKPMDDLFAHNEGLPSRFPHHFTFEDYNDAELEKIFCGMVNAESFKFKDMKNIRIAARRLGRQRGQTGFGNARAVRNMYDKAKESQARRVIEERRRGEAPDPLVIEREDILGPRIVDRSNCAALQELEAMEGLRKVKNSVKTLLSLMQTNAELEEQEKPLRDVCLNRVLVGNPGTGKTTVGGIYGRILKDLGMLSKGDVVLKTPQDFIGSVLGESEKNTKAILDNAKGCVLIIDEAYGLASPRNTTDPYRTAVIDTIVAEVQGVPGDDRCVLLLGYQQEINDMIRTSNPGLKRRFQTNDPFIFEDYNDDALFKILSTAAQKRQIPLDLKCRKQAVKVLAEERKRPNFGNAGAVNTLLSLAVQNMEKRMAHASSEERAMACVIPEDLLTKEQKEARNINIDDLFKGKIGCSSVKEQLRDFMATIDFAKSRGSDPLDEIELNFFFAGSPGTGKTTVARIIGQALCSIGLLGTDKVYECSATDLSTGYAGQAGKATREKFLEALGGVLFVDEAYRLNPQTAVGNPYMQEVLDEIVQLLTEEQFKGKMAVIFAGYAPDLDALLSANPGLKSRIPNKIVFEDFSLDSTVELLLLQLEKKALKLDGNSDFVINGVRALINAPHWSNGRDVDTFGKKIYQEAAKAKCDVVTEKIFQAALEACLLNKRGVAGEARPKPTLHSGLRAAPNQTAKAPTIETATTIATQMTLAEPGEEATCEEAEDEEITNHFAKIPKDFLKDIQDILLANDVDISDVSQILNFDLEDLEQGLRAKGVRPDVAHNLLQQWKAAMERQQEQKRKIEEEIAAKRRARKARWRCGICGRAGCSVAPYIEGYDEIEL